MVTPSFEALRPIASTVAHSARDRTRETAEGILHSEPVEEARRRGQEIIRAAKGESVGALARAWPVALMSFGAGAIAGLGLAFIARRMATPVPPTLDTLYDGGSARTRMPGGTIDLTDVRDPVVEPTTTITDVDAPLS